MKRLTIRRLPEFSSLVYVPIDSIDFENVSKQLTVDNQTLDDTGQYVTTYIRLYDLSRRGLIGLPRHFFATKVGGRYLDRTVKPVLEPSLYPHRVTPRDAAQADFMGQITDLLRQPRPVQAQANAATGSGKTAVTIGAIAETGAHRVMIAVHSNSLKNQWMGSIENKEGFRFFMGEKWTEKNVGIIQQGVCDYRDKLVVIGMMPSMIRREYPQELYDTVSVVVVDEIHKCAAPLLSDFLMIFKPRIILGMTATEKKGPIGKTISVHIGQPVIVSKQEVAKPRIYRIKYEREQEFYDPSSLRTYLTPLTRLEWRQDMLAHLIYNRGVKRGRQILLLSDRVHQLQNMRDRLVKMGMNPAIFGLFVGASESGLFKLIIEGSDSNGNVIKRTRLPTFPTRREASVYARAWLAENKLVEREIRIFPESVVTSDEELDRIKQTSTISCIGATFGKFADGLNIPRLDMGVELSPRGDVTQSLGRILRVVPGKKMPEWYSPFDMLYVNVIVNSIGSKVIYKKQYYPDLIRLEKQRVKSYRIQNAELIGIDNVEIIYR